MWGDKVEKIGTESFSNNKNLTTVSLPNSITEIEYGAFNGCENLSDIEIPDSVEAIGGFAFDNEGSGIRDTNTNGMTHRLTETYMQEKFITNIKEKRRQIQRLRSKTERKVSQDMHSICREM